MKKFNYRKVIWTFAWPLNQEWVQVNKQNKFQHTNLFVKPGMMGGQLGAVCHSGIRKDNFFYNLWQALVGRLFFLWVFGKLGKRDAALFLYLKGCQMPIFISDGVGL
ncbi:MAG: hypothetical protein JXA13_11065 [Anaerolineales bacterium]|nr:hypothetical protein [Anaerolineales bacterium]